MPIDLSVVTGVTVAQELRPHGATYDALIRGPGRKGAGDSILPGRPRQVPSNVRLAVSTDPRWAGRWRFDEFAGRVTVDGRPATDTDYLSVIDSLFMVYDLQVDMTAVCAGVALVADVDRYHPVADYLRGLVWDGKPRIDAWLNTYGGVERTPLTDAYARCTLIAAVRRALNPGCKVDTTLVLISGQGARKSSALAALCPDPAWFSDAALDPHDAKKTGELIAGKWIVELSELASVRKSDTESVRAMLTRQSDQYRPAYARVAQDWPRSCIFVGTSNAQGILTDPHGSRRFWPVTVVRWDVDALAQDRDQIWAEAYQAAIAEPQEPHWLPLELENVRVDDAEIYRDVDVWDDKVLTFAISRPDGFTLFEAMASLQIDPAQMSRINEIRLGNILTSAGYAKVRVRVGGVRVYRWLRSSSAQPEPAPSEPAGVGDLAGDIEPPW